MKAEKFVEEIQGLGIKDLIGVPDSTLKQFCDYINTDGADAFCHQVPVNEGAAVGLAMGSYLATGKPACVYMQNSGLGNTVNPVTSLANEEVYDVPMLFVIGWRGKPGEKDEPQHKFMGKVTLPMLEVLNIEHSVIDDTTTDEELAEIMAKAKAKLDDLKQYAIVVSKGTFETRKGGDYKNSNTLIREDAIASIIKSLDKDAVVISTTGKISREVYEQSDLILGNHNQDFLTVGGMGHASMIALGAAQKSPDKTVYCVDGDGAMLMHMGSAAYIGANPVDNLIHICLNNGAHESVGGMKTGAQGVQYAQIAKVCGYAHTYCVDTQEDLEKTLAEAKAGKKLTFVEVKVAMDSRADLGRPKETAVKNKEEFMRNNYNLQ